MGNFHCIPSGCAEVVYQEYEGAKVRWRYGNENWQEIEGDNYSLEEVQDLSLNTQYRVICRQAIVQLVTYQTNPTKAGWVLTGWGNEVVVGLFFSNGIDSYVSIFKRPLAVNWQDSPTNKHSFCTNDPRDAVGSDNRDADYGLKITSQGVTTEIYLGRYSGFWLLRIEPVNPSLRKTKNDLAAHKFMDSFPG